MEEMIEIIKQYIEGTIRPSEASAQIMALYGEESPYNRTECIIWMLSKDKCKGCPSFLICQKQAAVILALISLDKCQLQLTQSEGTEALQRIRKTIELVIGVANAKTEGEVKNLL